jgi:integrase
MALHNWCRQCNLPAGSCKLLESHKKEFQWRTDFLLGGVGGDRIRKYFRTKELAQAFESATRSDFLRGKLMPREMQSKIPFKQLAEHFYEQHVLVRIKNTRTERSHLNILSEYFGLVPIAQLTLKDGERFIQDGVKQGKKPGAINRDLHTLKSMLGWAVRNGYILASPFTYLKPLKEDAGRVRWLSKEELHRLTDACKRLGDRDLVDLIHFAVLTGFRRANLVQVTANDVGNGVITAAKTKSGNPYDVPISQALRSLLDKLPKSGKLLDTVNLPARFKRAVIAAGLWAGAYHPDTVSLHTLRHTFASWYLMNGGDIFKLQKMLGHASIQMTLRYSHLAKQDLLSQASMLNFSTEALPELQVI